MSHRCLAASLVLALSMVAGSAGARVFTVTKTADTLDGTCDADCSLREAVAAARAGLGGDIILVGPGVYRISEELTLTLSVTLRGAGAASTIIDADRHGRVVNVPILGFAWIEDLTLRGGWLPSGQGPENEGAGIRSAGVLTLRRCAVVDNQAGGSGGGIYNGYTLTVESCVIADNTALGVGGGIVSVQQIVEPPPPPGDQLVIRDTTIARNTATGPGGGLFAHSPIDVANTTISGNRSLTGDGGGIAVPGGSFTRLTHTTITDNHAAAGSAGASFSNGQGQALDHVLLAGNDRECAYQTDGKHNFRPVEGVDCSLVLPPPLHLAPLGSHGGPTPTHALLPGSPAIDAGAAGSCPAGTDQRGRSRPADGDGDGVARCDIGAVEATVCETTPGALCLLGRFLLTAHWRTRSGAAGQAGVVSLSSASGYFWFFDPGNVEVLAKANDACVPPFDRFWIFLAGLTDVEVEIEAVDTLTGERKTYTNPLGRPFAPQLDTDAFDSCP